MKLKAQKFDKNFWAYFFKRNTMSKYCKLIV